jgi:ribosomal protein S24E
MSFKNLRTDPECGVDGRVTFRTEFGRARSRGLMTIYSSVSICAIIQELFVVVLYRQGGAERK